MLLCRRMAFFQNSLFKGNIFQENYQSANGLESDQDRRPVGPDLSPTVCKVFTPLAAMQYFVRSAEYSA